MIRSVLLIVFISIAFTQCLPPDDNVSSLKCAKSANSANGNLFGCAHNFNKGGIRTSEKLEYFFGEQLDSDERLCVYVEHHIFENEKDFEVTVAYPFTEDRTFIVSYVRVLVFQDTTEGSAEIIQGGIDQKEFGIKITAKGIKDIVWHVFAYGRKP